MKVKDFSILCLIFDFGLTNLLLSKIVDFIRSLEFIETLLILDYLSFFGSLTLIWLLLGFVIEYRFYRFLDLIGYWS
jgi:hypothetical protein